MAPSLLLTAPLAPGHPFSTVDCVKRNVVLPPVTAPTHPAACSGPSPSPTPTTPTTPALTPTSTASSEPECTAYTSGGTTRARACPWSGTPIRAIMPLPRRARASSTHAQDASEASGARGVRTVHAPTSPSVAAGTGTGTDSGFTFGQSSCHMMRSAHVWEDAESTDSEAESEGTDGDDGLVDGGSDGERDVAPGSRYCSYESITAAQGLSGWSFEELRAECYAQSLVARGAKPPPVDQLSLAIPPAFVPRIVRLPRS